MLLIDVTAGTPKDRAMAAIDGRTFEARSSAGAVFALCRALMAAGVADQPFDVINTAAPGTVSMRGPSIRTAAGLTVAQPEDRPPHFRRWTPPSQTPAPGVSTSSPARACTEGPSEAAEEPQRVPVARLERKAAA
jgi:hypothetical protein